MNDRFFYLPSQQTQIIINWLKGIISDDEFIKILARAK